MGSTREAQNQNEQPFLSNIHAKDLWEHAEGDEKNITGQYIFHRDSVF